MFSRLIYLESTELPGTWAMLCFFGFFPETKKCFGRAVKVNCGLQMSKHFKKLERKISKNLGGDRFGVFYFRFLNVTFFSIIRRPDFFF